MLIIQEENYSELTAGSLTCYTDKTDWRWWSEISDFYKVRERRRRRRNFT